MPRHQDPHRQDPSRDIQVEADVRTVVEDLGIVIGPTEPVWLTRTELEQSLCLQTLIRLGKATIFKGKESRVTKTPKRSAPSVALSRPQQVTGRHQPQPQPQTAPTAPVVTPEQAATIARQAATAAVEAVLQRLPEPSPAPDLSDLDERIERAVHRALDQRGAGMPAPAPAPSGTPSRSSHRGPEDPVFIPAGIVRDKGETITHSIESTSSQDSGGVDEAAEALKALKKAKATK